MSAGPTRICAAYGRRSAIEGSAIEGSATVSRGVSYALVAHLGEHPPLTPFVNDLDRAQRGGTRLAVRHTAATPAVDVPLRYRFGPSTFHPGTIPGLENGEQAEATLRRGRYVRGGHAR